MPGTLLQLLVFASLLSLSCSSDKTSIERRGGPLPDGAAGESSVGAAGAAGLGDPIPFCDALAVIRGKCQRCHQDPPKNGAPVPFLTYEDTQAQYGMSAFKYSDAMIGVVRDDVMPYVVLNGPPTNLMPPVESLTPHEKATLLGWLNQGALPDGGTDCP